VILDAQLPNAIAQAAQALQRGELLGLPTETVYGLAADAGNDAAVKKIFAAKGRPNHHPLIVHVAKASDVSRFASRVPAFAHALMDAFWPGPLTLILPRRQDVAAVAAGGQDSVGLRCPAHPVAQAVLRHAQRLGVWGVAAPSANLFGRVSPTTAAHVAGEFDASLLVIDGGACDVGIESTIVDCSRDAPVLLRPGVLTPEQLSAACGVAVRISPALQGRLDEAAPRASGTLASHYAPNAKLSLMSATEIAQALQALFQASENHALPNKHLIAVWSREPVKVPAHLAPRLLSVPMPQEAAACAHELFAQLRRFDEQGASQIWVEAPPAAPAWDGVRDRLMRAATPAST
jgi:L-threonylcarbamoyladenylate synthase